MYLCGVCAHIWTRERGVKCRETGSILKLYLCRGQLQRTSCSVLLLEVVVRVGGES